MGEEVAAEVVGEEMEEEVVVVVAEAECDGITSITLVY